MFYETYRFWDMQTFDARSQLKMKFANTHTIENKFWQIFISLIKKRLLCSYPEILKSTVIVSTNMAFFYKIMHTLLLIHFQSGRQVLYTAAHNLDDCPSSTPLGIICQTLIFPCIFLSNYCARRPIYRPPLQQHFKHFHLCFHWASRCSTFLQHQEVKISKLAASIVTLWLKREEKPTLPTRAHSNINPEYFNYICHNTLREACKQVSAIYCVFGKGLGIALVPVGLTSYYDHLLYCVTDLLVTSPPIHVHRRAMYMAKLETVTWRLGTN